MIASSFHRLSGEQVALEPEARLARDQCERVGKGEEDEVVPTVGALEERAPVVDVDVHPRVAVRMIRVQLLPQLVEAWVDLDSIDPPRTALERAGDVVAGSRAHDQHLIERPHGHTVVNRLVHEARGAVAYRQEPI